MGSVGSSAALREVETGQPRGIAYSSLGSDPNPASYPNEKDNYEY